MASLRMLHIWDTRGLSSFRHLVVPSGRGKPPVGTETSGGGDPTLMRAILLSGSVRRSRPLLFRQNFFFGGRGCLWAAVLLLHLSLHRSLAQEKGEFKFI
ncbi:hypothetical protein AAFF_G00402920 [Aldrovandia affinis]|uniref:Uncharacterized protein n=1 Tax=Aldrovandia affinis TaxID=143900 RepID=A0AAD7T7I2_9TELE|nr:hypothetical protein AAFF_G00402920 [Aldrovandia affinis]